MFLKSVDSAEKEHIQTKKKCPQPMLFMTKKFSRLAKSNFHPNGGFFTHTWFSHAIITSTGGRGY